MTFSVSDKQTWFVISPPILFIIRLPLFVFPSLSVIDTYRQASYAAGLASVMMSALIPEWLLDNGYSHIRQALVIISLLADVFIGSHGEGWIDWVNRWAEERGRWRCDIKRSMSAFWKMLFSVILKQHYVFANRLGKRQDGMALISNTISQSLLLSQIKRNKCTWCCSIWASSRYRKNNALH